MSASNPPDLDLREQIVRIDRAIAESEKLRQESNKFIAGQRKLMAEAAKFDRDRFWVPTLAVAAAVAAALSLLKSTGIL